MDNTELAPLFLRAPAAVLLAAACLGVLADRYWPWTVEAWFLLIGVSLAVHCLSMQSCGKVCSVQQRAVATARSARRWFGRRAGQGCALAGVVAGLAGTWHHLRWHPLSNDNLARIVADDQDLFVPVLVSGLAESGIVTLPGASFPGQANPAALSAPRTRFRLRVRWLHRPSEWVPARGTVWVHVNGNCPLLRPGDEVLAWGNLARYQPPMNPGEYDFQALHRAQGELVYLEAPVTECVQVTPRPATWRSWLARLQVHWQGILERELNGDAALLAAALLLGARDGFSAEVRDDFLVTGTSHVLSISGLHVGILAAPWLFAARARLLHFRGALVSVVVIMALYAALTEGRAPVVRSSILVQMLCVSWLTRRRSSLVNSLGLAGLVVLLINPSDLFSAGTQLSFLAVATLGRCHRFGRRFKPTDPLDQLIRRTRPWWQRAARRSFERVTQPLLASLGVWLVTAPLVIQAFHIVSPIAVPLNLVLFPPLALSLQSGFALLLVADFWPPLTSVLASICQTSLNALQYAVRMAAEWPASHFWLVDPGRMAVTACYACIGLTWMVPDRVHRRWLGYLLAAICLLAGWTHKAGYRSLSDDRVRCTVLSVGHGTCVVLQWPGGPVWLYDAGCRGSIPAGVDRVARYLWQQGIGRIDGMVLSHSDLDHYGLMPGLIERFGVRRFFVGPGGLRRDDPGESWLVDELARQGVICETLAAGDRFEFGTEGAVTVLHPDTRAQFGNDNARSLVLAIRYQNTEILLPGDLEAEGLQSLLNRRPPPVDVAMAPHHGSLHSDPAQFLHWCRPRWCIISGGDGSLQAAWADHAATTGTILFHTAIHGAVEIDLAGGEVYVQSFRQAPAP